MALTLKEIISALQSLDAQEAQEVVEAVPTIPTEPVYSKDALLELAEKLDEAVADLYVYAYGEDLEDEDLDEDEDETEPTSNEPVVPPPVEESGTPVGIPADEEVPSEEPAPTPEQPAETPTETVTEGSTEGGVIGSQPSGSEQPQIVLNPAAPKEDWVTGDAAFVTSDESLTSSGESNIDGHGYPINPVV